MNGTVAPSSSNATAAATCSSRTQSSFAISRSMEVVTLAPIAMETDGADNNGPPHGADMDVGALILQPPKLQCPRRDSRQNQNGRRTSGFAHEYYPLFPASADTSTPT